MCSSHFIVDTSEEQGLVGNVDAQAVEAAAVEALEHFYRGTTSTCPLPTLHVRAGVACKLETTGLQQDTGVEAELAHIVGYATAAVDRMIEVEQRLGPTQGAAEGLLRAQRKWIGERQAQVCVAGWCLKPDHAGAFERAMRQRWCTTELNGLPRPDAHKSIRDARCRLRGEVRVQAVAPPSR